MNHKKKIPVVMDCDPGNDDALAMVMAYASEQIELRAVTTVAGNLNREVTAKNALEIVEYFQMDLPVSRGSYPLMKPFEALDVAVMGEGGMGNVRLPEAKGSYSELSSVELLHREALRAEGELRILATGPLTNLALLVSSYPQDKGLIREIVLMGGSVNGGNHTPRAEFNIYTDAEAAKMVFGSGVPIRMIGTDVTYRTPVFLEELSELLKNGNKTARFIGDLMFYPGTAERPFPEEGLFIWDALAAAALIDSTCMEWTHCYVDVETKGELTYGETVADIQKYLKRPPNTYVAMDCRKEAFLEMVRRTITTLG